MSNNPLRVPPRLPLQLLAGVAVASAVLVGSIAAPQSALAGDGGVGSAGEDVIPRVDEWKPSAGEVRLDEQWRIVVATDQADLENIGGSADLLSHHRTVSEVSTVFARDLNEAVGLSLPAGTGVAGARDIEFVLRDDGALPPAEQTGLEGYRLSIDADEIRVEAATTSGLYYGGRSVLQALRASEDHRTLVAGSALDVPDDAVRPYTMDVSREFWTPREVEDVIRQMGWMKQNMLILHFDDAEYFRLNSPHYPGLADPEFSYDEEDIKSFVDLGHENGVTLVPAFEFPAHLSHKAAYFHIGMGDGPVDVAPGFGTRDTGATSENSCGPQYSHGHLTEDFTMNFMHPKAMRIAREVLDEFVPWFDSPWVHVGGDEVPPNLESCPALRTWMANQADEQLKSLSGVEQWIINQLDDHLETLGRRTIVYNGFENGIPLGESAKVHSDVIVQLWTGPDDAVTLRPYDKILGNADRYYLVPARNTSPAISEVYQDRREQLKSNSRELGRGMHIWGDDLGWAEGQFLETMAYAPRAVTADRSWNAASAPRIDIDVFLHNILPRVGTAPFYVGEQTPEATADASPIRSWLPAATDFPPGLFDAHSGDNRRALTEVCSLNGMTPLFSGVTMEWDPRFGQVQGGAFWNLGAPDIRGEWTFSATVKIDGGGSEKTALLGTFDSYESLRSDGSIGSLPERGIDIDNGEGKVGIRSKDGEGTFDFEVPRETWSNLTFVSDGMNVTLYVDGVRTESIKIAAALPLQRLGSRNVTFAAAQAYARALNPDQVMTLFKDGPAQAACQPGHESVVTPLIPFEALPPTAVEVSAEGPMQGGTEVTITGRSLTLVTDVMFGGESAASVRVVDDRTVVAVSPPLPAGSAKISLAHAKGLLEVGTFNALTMVHPSLRPPAARSSEMVEPASDAGTKTGILPNTGGELPWLVCAIGLMSLAAGVLLLVKRRETRHRKSGSGGESD